jgi:hypothetical protein
MEPFFAGYSPRNQSLVVAPPFEAWENVVANAGLAYQQRNGKDAKDAARLLQYELDDAHATLVYTGKWRLVAGYDSARNEVQLQSRGAQYDTETAAELATQWKQRSPLGSPFGLLSFHTPGEVARLKAAPASIDRVQEPGAPAPLLNLAALHALSGAMQRLATREVQPSKPDAPLPPPTGQLPVRAQENNAFESGNTGDVTASPDGTATPIPAADGVSAPVTPPAVETPSAPPRVPSAATPGVDKVQRARALIGWRGAPLQRWVAARRQAAAYLDTAAVRLRQPSLRRAADEFRNAVTALENAANVLPAANALGTDGVLNERARRAFEMAAREIERARLAETRATDLMSSVQ